MAFLKLLLGTPFQLEKGREAGNANKMRSRKSNKRKAGARPPSSALSFLQRIITKTSMYPAARLRQFAQNAAIAVSDTVLLPQATEFSATPLFQKTRWAATNTAKTAKSCCLS